ncbi:MAG: C10 family peptidase [Bacteroidales bacterium]|nr:C10 family peptidase [Bacteroidales bacterium]
MKKVNIFIFLIVYLISCQTGIGQFVDKNEASSIAKNWIQIVSDRYGDWAESGPAVAGPIQEFRNNGHLIGYYCQVEPQGFIVMSLRRELAPVKASSDEGVFDPTEEGGIVQLLKDKMTSLINAIESEFGGIETANPEQVKSMCGIDYLPAWEMIQAYIPGTLNKDTIPSDNYIQGQELLTTCWHQHPPYNNMCPYMGCTNTTNGCALVGCVATAAAQLMRYWAYPPWYSGGSAWYDWRNMVDAVNLSSPQVQQDAVAVLNSNIGAHVGMQYGCTASSVPTASMTDVYHNIYFYANCGILSRDDYSDPMAWYAQIQLQLNLNRPIHYRVENHSIVCDGWRTSTGVPQYHMNYGWTSPSYNTWYTLDALIYGTLDEYMIINIYPVGAVGAVISGTYTPMSQLPFRYFDMDAAGSNALFTGGQWIQFLEGIKIKGTGNGTGVYFSGTSANNIILITDGKYDEGIVIKNGAIRLKNNGMMSIK